MAQSILIIPRDTRVRPERDFHDRFGALDRAAEAMVRATHRVARGAEQCAGAT